MLLCAVTRLRPRRLDGRRPSSRCCSPLVAATLARAACARSVDCSVRATRQAPQQPASAPTRRDAAPPPQFAVASHSLPTRAPTAPHVAQHITHVARCAPSASSADRTATLRAVCSSHARTHSHNAPGSRDAAGSPAHRHLALASSSRADRTAQCVAHNAHNTARHASRAAHCARPLATPHPRNHNAPTRRDAAGSSARRRLALAFGSRADRAASCATPGARSTLRPRFTRSTLCASLHTHTPDRTVNAPRGAQQTTHATRCAPSASRADRTAPLRAVCSSLAHTHSHERPEAPRRSSPPARRRLALASGSRVDRTAMRNTPRTQHVACLPHTHAHPALAKRHIPALVKRHAATSAPTRRDTADSSARRRLALASGSRADRTAPCATHFARNTLRATLRTQQIARRPLNTHTHA